ncbi:hypothetical protein [Lacihabitans sp. CCS-44]|uniref:hypothetical protein n=1 Tax=Lacihabitans sp. CCS-44 TaxID=2487331 RepID=UPI0020CF3D3D|nr:hypothetical protein [Lacihabitans sp. CCS-44]
MKDLIWIRENWAIFLSLFFVFSLASFESSYGFYKISILPYINLQEALIYFFRSFLDIGFLTLIAFITFYFFFNTQKIQRNRATKVQIFLAIIYLFYIIVSGIYQSVDVYLFKVFIREFDTLVLIILVIFFLSFIDSSMIFNISNTIFRYFTWILLLFLVLVFSNILKIEQSKKEQYIIKLEKEEIVTGYGKYIIYNSPSIIIIHNNSDNTNTVIPKSEIKSLIDCNYRFPKN